MERTIITQVSNRAVAIQTLADGYRTKINDELWLANGLQKDAIQNSWDARKDKKHGKDWECGFSLIEADYKKFLCIEDKGTSGLNGTKFNTPSELAKILEKISNENKRDEDLACFLNSDWSSKSAEEGGNRGRGKTLFLFASKNKRVYFDSLRMSDNSYIFGEIYLDSADKQVKFSLSYDEGGKKMLRSEIGGDLRPISWYGTRVFILNPDDAVIRAIKEGELISFISNSRWETLKKFGEGGVKIFVSDGKDKKYVSFPYWYEDNLKGVENKEFGPEIIKDKTHYKIKRLVLRYAPNLDVPLSLKGIAIQRGGMTIQRIPAEELVKEQGVSDIYGWLEMERDPLEEEMKQLEGPEHFDFSWVQNPARYLRSYMQGKIREFAKEFKIIESEQTKKNKIQKQAEDDALKLLAPLFKKLKLFGKHRGKGVRTDALRKKNEPLRLSMPDIEFPREVKRLNHGEKIRGSYVIPINEFGEDILVIIRIFLVSSDGRHMEMIEEKQINLHEGNGPKIGTDEILISKKYKAGGYSLRAKMTSLEEKKSGLPDGTKIEKGTILYDRINQKFYVEMDPPESGPFAFQPEEKDDKSYLFKWEQQGDGYIIYYNSLHPHIKPLLEDQEKLTAYFIEQGSLLALQIKLEELIAEDDKEDKEFTDLIKAKNIAEVYRTFLARHSEFLWDLKQ